MNAEAVLVASTSAPNVTNSSGLPDNVYRAIYGPPLTAEEKQQDYEKSLHSWWREYTSRKNNEEEEHVADSLLYDERCHLPRTTPPPVFTSTTTTGVAPAVDISPAAVLSSPTDAETNAASVVSATSRLAIA